MPESSTPTKLKFSSSKVLIILILTIALLALTHIILQFLVRILNINVYEPLVRVFDVDNEVSIPTWYSQILLFIPALLAVFIFQLEKQTKDRNGFYWILLASLFLYLSIDEGAMLHEAMIDYFRVSTNSTTTTGFLYYLWLFLAAILILLLLIPFIRFAKRLPKRTVILLSFGMALYVFGAIIYETLGLIFISKQEGFAYYGINVVIEESIEMLGASLVIYALLEYIRMNKANLSVKLLK